MVILNFLVFYVNGTEEIAFNTGTWNIGFCFQYFYNKFLILSEANLKEGIFDGSQVRRLMKDTTFHNSMTNVEKMYGLVLKV